jgi:CBS domain containing-hemolysin-like protein
MEIESTLFELFVVVILIIGNAFFVAAEFALVKVRYTELESIAKKENKRAKLAVSIISQLDKYLSACQLGITMTSLGLGWIGEPVTAKILSPVFSLFSINDPAVIKTLSFAVGFIVITFIHITLGEQAPKFIGIKHPRASTLFVAIPLRIFYIIFKPVIYLINITSNAILRSIGIKPDELKESVHSEEEIRLLIAEGKKSGAIDSTEHQLIEKIFEFNDKIAREIMVPRNNMIALNINSSRDKIYQIATEEGFSRMPVYKDTVDNIVGIIYTKDLISAAEHRELITIQDIIRPVTFVSASKNIGDLLKELQKQKAHLAIVVDEYGGVEGIVTIEDIIEEIVGEIQDEYDVEISEVVHEKKGVYLINPIIQVEDFNQKLKVEIPEDEDYKTVSGFLQKVTGHIPEVYERIDYKGLSFIITKKTGNQIQQVRVQKI